MQRPVLSKRHRCLSKHKSCSFFVGETIGDFFVAIGGRVQYNRLKVLFMACVPLGAIELNVKEVHNDGRNKGGSIPGRFYY